ncbi:MAG TPA: asparagine synthase (glutamine-hydrolyzing) [Flavobacterium sp.]|jgi:asparagine synthase (glutamine-hydrolysing)
MCGINGFVTTAEKSIKDIDLMNDAIFHRGPDEEGVFFEQKDGTSIAMGMRRLSIIDLHTGKQPIYSDDGLKVILFNGEIYNYKVLRDQLLQHGESFKTTSDTEVILKLYEKEGVSSFVKLDGMFAFSIYDKILNKIFIARDFFGEKPLYYTSIDGTTLWASELKSVVKVLKSTPQINKTALNLYFQLTYIPAPYTIYEGIHKLEPNHFLTIDLADNSVSISEIKQQFEKYDSMGKDVATKKVHDMVFASVALRSVSDVPIGTFLSGGVDSSIVSYCLSQNSPTKINTFSIGFEKKSFDETDKSQMVAKMIGSNHHQFVIGEKDLSENLHQILNNFDEPFADSSALPSYVVAQKTREHVKVALTGDGGDEVFGGYNKYYMGQLNSKITGWVPEKFHHAVVAAASPFLKTKDDNRGYRFKLDRLLKAVNYKGDFYYNIISLGFQRNEIPTFIKPDFVRHDSLKFYKDKIGDSNRTLHDFRNIDRLLSLEGDMLVKVDRTSMLTSLECRAPFLNKNIWNFTSQLPENFLMNKWDKKHILKEAFKQYFPQDFLNKSKKGFGVPVGDWLRSFLKDELLSYSERNLLEKQDIFHPDAIIKLVQEHVDGKADNTFRVWTFYCFQKWYTQHGN